METEEFYNKRNIVENKKEKANLSDGGRKILKILSNYKIKRFLDIGCGDIFLSKNIITTCNIETYYGVDISENGVSEANLLGIKAKKLDINVEKLPYQDNYFDFILAGEIIEHLFDPDIFLSEVYRVLQKDGYFILTTPNLASWHNRIALMLGYQPHYSEVSIKYNIGKLFPTNKTDVSGHLRVFTLRALKGLLKLYQFQIVKVIGHGTGISIDKIISNYMPNLSTGLIVLCKK